MAKKRRIVNIIGLISAVIFMISLAYNQFVPSIFRWSAFTLVALFVLVMILKKLPKVLIIFLSVVLILTSSLLFYTQRSAERILDYFEVEVNVVSFVVLKTNPIEKIEDAEGKFFGALKIMEEELSDQIVREVKKQYGFNLNLLNFGEKAEAISALDDGNIDVLMLDDSILEFLVEDDPQFITRIRVIHTMSKEIIKEDITKDAEIDEDSFVVLLSGIDTAGSINRRSRSDVNMLLVVNPVKSEVLMVSLPRDLYVALSCKDNKYDKLTHSGIYGINCTVKTIENFLEIDINYYVRLNFTSFINIVDAMGGVSIYNESAFVSHDGAKFSKGNLTLNGTFAYHYVRERKAFEDGDGQRIKNQQKVLTALIEKMISPKMFTKIENIVGIVSKNIDTNITSTEISRLIKLQINTGSDWQFSSAYITGTDAYRTTYSMGDKELYVVLPDAESLLTVQESIMSTMDE